MKLYTKKRITNGACKTNTYYVLGMPLLRKEYSEAEKKTTLCGICIRRKQRPCSAPSDEQHRDSPPLDVASLFAAKEPPCTREIDIVIPVYNGLEYLETLFDTLLNNTDLPYHLYVINDASPDERILPFLKQWEDKFNGKMLLMSNEHNLGFLRSVNAALAKTAHDVALVNTDVILPQRWASRLFAPIFQDDKVAAVTTFSNCADYYSLPVMGKDNVFGGDLENVNQLLSQLNTPYQTFHLPSGVGFCLALSRAAIQKIGVLDEVYGKGYAEEYDWCQRAIQAGFYITIAADLFVWHKHGGSFASAEKEALMKKNGETLLSRFPRYHQDVADTLRNESFALLRNIAELFTLCDAAPETQVWFDHTWGGGTESYSNMKFQELKDTALLIRVQNSGDDNMVVTYLHRDFENKAIFRSREDLLRVLSHMPINQIVLNNLAGYKDMLATLDDIAWLKQRTGAWLSFRGHDLQCICPSITMSCGDTPYCQCQHLSQCESCYASIKEQLRLRPDSIRQWQDTWRHMLVHTADEIIVFSQSTFDILAHHYPETASHMSIIPHRTQPLRKLRTQLQPHEHINIVVLGHIHEAKGAGILKQMDSLLEQYPHVRITVVGLCSPLPHIVSTGAYQTSELPRIMEEQNADIVFIPSIWPETFSYTTAEAISMGLPVACFNLGAPAERLRDYDKGLVISKIDADTALKEISRFVLQLRQAEAGKAS